MVVQSAQQPVISVTTQALVERLEHFVHARTNGMVRNLEILVLDGEVIISGKAHTYYTKQLATHAIFAVVQDYSLTNNIEVG